MERLCGRRQVLRSSAWPCARRSCRSSICQAFVLPKRKPQRGREGAGIARERCPPGGASGARWSRLPATEPRT